MNKIEYYKNKRGLIIPPPPENGKLVDGSDAPADPIGAKADQRTILAQYDKLILAKAESKHLVNQANREIKDLATFAEQAKLDQD